MYVALFILGNVAFQIGCFWYYRALPISSLYWIKMKTSRKSYTILESGSFQIRSEFWRGLPFVGWNFRGLNMIPFHTVPFLNLSSK